MEVNFTIIKSGGTKNPGHDIMVSTDRLHLVQNYKWRLDKDGYAIGHVNGKNRKMHRIIMGCGEGDKRVVDHINGNRLDNRTENLRFCTPAQNVQNMKKKEGKKHQWKGYAYREKTKKYQAMIKHNNKTIHIGMFDTEREAAEAYDEKAFELFGEFANLNFNE